MRTCLRLTAVALGAVWLPCVAAAQETGPTRFLGSIDFGVRLTAPEGDEARYQRYRDLRDGGVLDRLRLQRDWGEGLFSVEADHVGYRDQRYRVEFAQPGRVQASFEWDQVPLFISRDTRTLYSTSAPGVLVLDDGLQRSIENGTASLADFRQTALGFDTRSRRDTARFNLIVNATRELDVIFKLTSTKRDGTQPWAASFGFNNAIEVAAPIDHRTTDATAAAEWANDRGLIKVSYDGSFFNNEIQTLVWDNPVKITNSTGPRAYVAGDGTSLGRTALWPSNRAHTVSALGSIKLPARSRANAYVSVGSWTQDEELLPFTINPAIDPIPLARSTADAEARITSMAYGFASRPTSFVSFNARYRLYDFDNRTPVLPVSEYVRFDNTVEPSAIGGTEPFGYTRHFVDVDASFTPLPFTAFRVGYGREQDDRTFRFLEQTAENVYRASADVTGNRWVSLRTVYEYAKRTGTGFDEEALDGIGEQRSLRQFDISDRNRHRVTTIVQFTPTSELGISASVATGRDTRPDAELGLQENDVTTYSIGFDAVPTDSASFGLTYGYEEYSTLQESRQANPGPQFDDPTRNWSTDGLEKVHTISASADLMRLFPRTEIRVGYDVMLGRLNYTYILVPNSPLGPIEQLPRVLNELYRMTADARYFVTDHVALGIVYWYDRYDVEDFALGPQTVSRIDLPGTLLLGSVYRPYRAHSTWLRLSYLW